MTNIEQGMSKELHNLLVKPAGADCNLRCEYCFYIEKCALYPGSRIHRMSDEVLSAMVEQMMALGGENPTFGWQGGEPTLMGLDFFRRVVEYQKRFGFDGQTVGNGLQTNGFVINEEWADFLAGNHFLVGLSLDGPQHVHDHYRHTAGGQATWERVVRTSRLLRARGTETNALVVVSDYSARFPEEIYDFLRSEGYDFIQFIPIVETRVGQVGNLSASVGQVGNLSASEREVGGVAKRQVANLSYDVAPFSLTGQAFGEFMCRVFDKWLADFRDGMPTVSIRWFDSLLFTYVGLPAPECPLHEECGIYLCIEHNGDVYPCDFFVESEWKLGNVLTDRLDHLLNGETMTAFGRIKTRMPVECAECHWYRHCYGGCTKDRIKDPLDRGSNHFCEGFKMFFQHADKTFKRLAGRWRRQQDREALREARERSAASREQRSHAAQPSPYAAAGVGRNAPCPCGSGRKYKHCCGRTG